jgi:hypothetical protein
MGGLLGDDAAIDAAIDRGAERVVLSTRTDDLDELASAHGRRRRLSGALYCSSSLSVVCHRTDDEPHASTH